MEVIDWSPQSPDLNPIKALWGDIETELGETFGRIENLELLKIELKNTWYRIGSDRLDNLVRSMPRCLEAVIAAGGNMTPY